YSRIDIGDVRQAVGSFDLRHRRLVLQAFFRLLERRRQVEDGPAVLDGDHAPHGEAAAVARAVDLVDDGGRDVAAAQEVRVQRMRHASVHRVVRRRQGLAENLPAENLRAADVPALAAKNVVLYALEAQQPQEIL